MYNNSTANFVINDINKIIWASNNAKNVFGYKKTSHILKISTNSLMPIFFGKTHDTKVKLWLETGKCRKMNKSITIWCKK